MDYRRWRRWLVFILILCVAASSTSARAAEPTLRLDLDMQGPSKRLAIVADRAGHTLFVSSGDDRVRAFDALGSVLLRTLRIPSGPRGASVTSITVSPNGQLLAIALEEPDPVGSVNSSIVVLHWRQGRILRRLSGLGKGILGATFSPDGTRLAVSLSDEALRLYGVHNGEEIGRDVEAGGPSLSLDSAPDGRIVTSSVDGALRLYDGRLKLLRKVQLSVTPEGTPAVVRISPDGKRIALGYKGVPRVEIYSAEDLSLLSRPSVDGAGSGDLHVVAWSQSGAVLYAAGAARLGERYRIRCWLGGGQGNFKDLSVDLGAVTGLLPLPQERLAYATLDAAWGVLTSSGDRVYGHERESPVFLPGKLGVDRTGSRVRFAFVPAGRKDGAPISAAFSVLDHTLTESSANSAPPPSLAVPSSDLPPGALTAAKSGDARLVVAAHEDGTIRWYTADGRTLLSFLSHIDGKRWIAWTPGGYYDASAGGESLLGFQVERGQERVADFFPISLFRDRLYRPDVIARVLFAQDEAQAVAAADAESQRERPALPIARLLPPVVTILDPIDGAITKSNSMTVRVAVRSPSGEPVKAVRALVQGRIVQTRDVRDLVLVQAQKPTEEHDADAAVYALQVTLPEEDCTLAILVETALVKSEAALLRLRWAGARTVRAAGPLPDLYVLAVGTSKYRQPRLRLEYPAKDASDLVTALSRQEGKHYRKVEARLLTDETATRSNILEGLAWLRQKSQPADTAVLFLAGHGMNETSDGKYYYLPHDAEIGAAADTMVDAGQLQVFLSSIRGKVLLFIDTCHSGNVLGPQRGQGGLDVTRVVTELASVESGVVVYAAATGGQTSRESSQWGNGAFTKAVVEGLRGKADYSRSGRITVSSLEHYISNRVRELTHDEQTPTTAKPSTVPDFLIATVPPPIPPYKKAWFWGMIGVSAAAIAGLSAGLGVAYQNKGVPNTPGGTFMLTFPGLQ